MRSLNVSPGACGILGAISLNGNTFSGNSILDSISAINYRGSDLGAGFSYFEQSYGSLSLEAFASGYDVIEEVVQEFGESLRITASSTMRFRDRFGEKLLWSAVIGSTESPLYLETIVDRINSRYPFDEKRHFRVVSLGNGMHIRKGVGFPGDIYSQYPDLPQVDSHLWIAHTRQPTNSPGSLPIFSHPFSSYNIAVVHNGDISSFGANVQALVNQGMNSFVGTDSELIARILGILIHKHSLGLEESLSVMCGRYRHNNEFGGFSLDGPFSVAAAVRLNGVDYLIAMVDRSKLRPALIGISDSAVIVASERNQIKALGNDFDIVQMRGGQFMIASSRGDVVFG